MPHASLQVTSAGAKEHRGVAYRVASASVPASRILNQLPAAELGRQPAQRHHMMKLLDPYSSTRRWLKVGLATSGALAGATFGIALTRLGKIITDAPPATVENYAWNAAVFGLVAAVVSPVVSWSMLRRAPLWRTVAEPLGYAVLGGGAAVFLGVPMLLIALPPAGLVFGFARLRHRYPDAPADAPALPSARPANER
jgi:hypothetical protein